VKWEDDGGVIPRPTRRGSFWMLSRLSCTSNSRIGFFDSVACVVLSILALSLSVPAYAGDLADLFSSGALAGLELGPIGPALANTVASTYPVASASSSVTYAFNPKTETFERQTGILGPIVGERAETIGKGQVNISFSYSWVDLSTINGDS